MDDLEKIRNNAKCIWDKSNQYEEQSKELLKDAGIVTGAGAIAMAAALFITAITFGAGAPLIAVAAGIIVLLAPVLLLFY
ncbi:MAG: hypothetical protein NKF70_00960 [Methanobacterium sp. ERen5]|nr:MAG: hypothetical protein NKF70_00960 [Methanobacterium sp. ERen5]